MKRERITKIITAFTIIATLITLISGAFRFIMPRYLAYKFNIKTNGATSIGVIGGTDGPTSIFVTTQPSLNFITYPITLIFAGLSIAGIIYIIFTKRDVK